MLQRFCRCVLIISVTVGSFSVIPSAHAQFQIPFLGGNNTNNTNNTGSGGFPNLQGLPGNNTTGMPNVGSFLNGGSGGMQMPGGFNFNQITSQIPGFGNMNSMSQLTGMFQNPSVQSALGGMSGLQQGNFIDGLLKGSTSNTGGSNMLSALTGGNNGANGGALAETISKAAPALSAVLGGSGEIGKAVASLIGGGGGLGGAATAAAQQQQQQQQQQQNQQGGGDDKCNAEGCTQSNSCQKCHTDIPNHYGEVRSEITSEFEKHRSWIINTYWLEHILPALMLMAEQLTAAGIAQVNMIGALLDAKHQLETQRLMQQLSAEAHKDYQPSEGMCTFGTTVRSLAGSERRSNLAQMAFAQRMTQRQALSGHNLTIEDQDSDMRSRLAIFISTYCDQADNANQLDTLCKSAVPKAERRNIDVDYTRNIESRLTLDADFLPPENGGADTQTEDEQDVFALSANLFSHNIAPRIEKNRFGTENKEIRWSVAQRYMDLRAVFAKRSVAQNSFAALASMRAAGDVESAPYTRALIKELGVEKSEDIDKLLGKNPSYFAQMEILTKKIYQNPLFYTELYDKPANVERKAAALQAIGLMQDRDYYNSLLRSEAVLAVLLETMLQREQEKVVDSIGGLKASGGAKK